MKKSWLAFMRRDTAQPAANSTAASSSAYAGNYTVTSTSLSSSASSSLQSASISSSSSSSSLLTTPSPSSPSSYLTSSTSSNSTSIRRSSSSSSFSRIGGLNTASVTASSPNSQSPYYPSATSAGTSSDHQSSFSTASTSAALPKVSSRTTSKKTVRQSTSDAPTSTAHATSTSTPSSSASFFSQSASPSVSQADPSALGPDQELASATVSYSQEYIITGSSSTFTEMIATQTVVSYTVDAGDSTPSYTSSYSAAPIVTDLSYYQSVLSSHGLDADGKNSAAANKKKIIGGAVGGVVGMLLAALLLWLLLFRKKKRGKNPFRSDEENPFAGATHRSTKKFSPAAFITKTLKNSSTEELNNEKSVPFYGADNTNTGAFRRATSMESVTSSNSMPLWQRRGSGSSFTRPGLPPRKSSEESLGLGGLSKNLLLEDEASPSPPGPLQIDAAKSKTESYYSSIPSNDADIINSGANSPTAPQRQMDVVYEEEDSSGTSTPVVAAADTDNMRTAHYKQSSRYNHIGLIPVPPSELRAKLGRAQQPPPIPKPRKIYNSAVTNEIYDTMNVQRHTEELSDDNSFDSSLLDLSSIDDLSSTSGSSHSR